MWLPLLAVCALLSCLYSMRVRRVGGPTIYVPPESRTWIGALYHVLVNYHRHHDWKLEWQRRAEAEGKEVTSWCIPASPSFISVLSPRVLKYVLQDGFENFESQSREQKD